MYPTVKPVPKDYLKTFFAGLFHPDISKYNISGIKAVPQSRDDIFSADREIYDFEANLPPAVLSHIRALADNADKDVKPPSITERESSVLVSRRVQSRPIPPIGGPSLYPSKLASRIWEDTLAQVASTPPRFMRQIDDYGRELVHNHSWKIQDIVDLVRHICWKGSEPDSDTHPLSMALLAFSVYSHFRKCGDHKNSSIFATVLQDCVIGCFTALWDVKHHHIAIWLVNKAHSAPAHVACARRFVAFTGCLYRCEMITRSTITGSLWILVQQLMLPQQLYAIYDLVACSQLCGRGDDKVLLVRQFASNFFAAIYACHLQVASPELHYTVMNILNMVAEQSGCNIHELPHPIPRFLAAPLPY